MGTRIRGSRYPEAPWSPGDLSPLFPLASGHIGVLLGYSDRLRLQGEGEDTHGDIR